MPTFTHDEHDGISLSPGSYQREVTVYNLATHIVHDELFSSAMFIVAGQMIAYLDTQCYPN
jgi:hypothetical protein